MEPATKDPVRISQEKQNSPRSWHPFEDLHHQIDRLFEDFSRSSWLRPANSRFDAALEREKIWKAPTVDISESEDSYDIKAEMPGMDANNVEVSLRNGNIVIHGEKREESEEKRKDYYVKERQFGSFERVFALPEGIDVEKIAADYQNGVLTVKLPKSAQAKTAEKKIAINAA